MAKKSDKKVTLDLALAAIEKKHSVVLKWLKDVPGGHDFISTGCLGLDYALGGGFVRGRIIEIYGDEGSGKSTLALSTIAAANKAGHTAFYSDIERALDPKLPLVYGVDPNMFILNNAPVSVEKHFDIIESVIRSGEVSICVLDSIPALITTAEMDADTDKEFMGKIPKFLSEKIRRLIQLLGESNTLFIFINQTRSNLSPYGNPVTTPGGRAVRFYSTHRVSLSGAGAKSRRIMDDKTGDAIGHRMTFEVVKNKISAPFRKGDIDLIWGKGYDLVGELVDVGISFGLIDKGGSWLTYCGKKYQGKSNMRDALLEDDIMRNMLRGDIKTFLYLELSDDEKEAMASKTEPEVE